MKKALILDLDNTIYPVNSIAPELFAKLFAVLDQHLDEFSPETMNDIKDDLQRRHYHLVAEKFNFGPELMAEGLTLLKNLAYTQPMKPFDDYPQVASIALKKFLVTTGFSKLQWSKVKMLDLEKDFEEIHIVDPEISNQTKKDVFADILKRYGYAPADVLVIGDDPESEIKAAIALGIDTFLFDPEDMHPSAVVSYKSSSLKDVANYLD
jgi:putative hydrolase of the HAD superfamily